MNPEERLHFNAYERARMRAKRAKMTEAQREEKRAKERTSRQKRKAYLLEKAATAATLIAALSQQPQPAPDMDSKLKSFPTIWISTASIATSSMEQCPCSAKCRHHRHLE